MKYVINVSDIKVAPLGHTKGEWIRNEPIRRCNDIFNTM